MSNDVKVTQADEQAAIDFLRSCPSVPWSLKDELAERFTKHLLRHQPQREAVLEAGDIEWLRKELFAAKLLASHQSQKRIERILAALTTPAPSSQPEPEAAPDEARKACRFPCAGHYRAKVRGRFQCTDCGDILTTSEHAALTTPAAAVSRDEIVAVLERCRDREHNPFEPDNQTTLYGDLCTILSRLGGDPT